MEPLWSLNLWDCSIICLVFNAVSVEWGLEMDDSVLMYASDTTNFTATIVIQAMMASNSVVYENINLSTANLNSNIYNYVLVVLIYYCCYWFWDFYEKYGDCSICKIKCTNLEPKKIVCTNFTLWELKFLAIHIILSPKYVF